jgi:hypothetical protein
MISRMGQLPSRRTRPSHPIHSNNNNMHITIQPASISLQPHRLLSLYLVRLQPRGPDYQVEWRHGGSLYTSTLVPGYPLGQVSA